MEPTSPLAPAAPAVAAPAAAPEGAPNPEKALAARELIQGLLTRMGVTAEVGVDDRADGITVSVNATAGGEALGGGRRSGVVESISYLVNKAINRDEAGRKWVSLAVQGIPEATGDAPPAGAPEAAAGAAAAAPIDPATQALAEDLVARARKVGGALWLVGVPASQRGALQAALGKVANAKVRVEGDGTHRRLVVEAS